MKNLIVLMSLLVTTLNVSAQTIVEVPQANDPVEFVIYKDDDSNFRAFRGVKATFVDGSPALVTDGYGRLLISFNVSKVQETKSTYSVYSKNGAELAKHEINSDKLIRFLSLGGMSSISLDIVEVNGTRVYEYTVKCPLTVEISRNGFVITKVTPSCDDLQ